METVSINLHFPLRMVFVYVSLASVIELYTNKFAGYASGYGTVLFFDDTSVVEQNMKRHHR